MLAGEDEKLICSNDEDDAKPTRWSVIGKVISPFVLHLNTIMGVMRPVWGNPCGMKPCSVGDNLFIVDFVTPADKERYLDGIPWLVGKHTVLLQDIDLNLKPSEAVFDRMLVWVRILDLPFKGMHDGKQVAKLVGVV